MINGTSLYNSTHTLLATNAKMEILREFLESSTIHGLSYISSSKVRPNKSIQQIMFFVKMHIQ